MLLIFCRCRQNVIFIEHLCHNLHIFLEYFEVADIYVMDLFLLLFLKVLTLFLSLMNFFTTITTSFVGNKTLYSLIIKIKQVFFYISFFIITPNVMMEVRSSLLYIIQHMNNFIHCSKYVAMK